MRTTEAVYLSQKRGSLLNKAVSIATAAVQVPCKRFIGCRIGANRGVRVGERLLQSPFLTFSTGCTVCATARPDRHRTGCQLCVIVSKAVSESTSRYLHQPAGFAMA